MKALLDQTFKYLVGVLLTCVEHFQHILEVFQVY